MKDNAHAMVMTAFAADSLALGVHWIYNTNVIDRKVGRVEKLLKPIVKSWHPNREQGEFTHYGDQTLVLLESVAACGAFDLADFARRWQALFQDYDGYVDKATKATLKNFAAGRAPEEAGSDSTDLGGAARMTALGYLYGHDAEAFTRTAVAQARMTHNHPHVLASAGFFARVTAAVLAGSSPVDALQKAAGEAYEDAPVGQWVEQGLASSGGDTRKTIIEFGQECETEAAFPATVHLIAKYEDDLREALVQNVMAGGDSSARGMLAGMVLAARLGPDAIPADWLADLKARARIEELLSKIQP